MKESFAIFEAILKFQYTAKWCFFDELASNAIWFSDVPPSDELFQTTFIPFV